jgi:hypothetical protein
MLLMRLISITKSDRPEKKYKALFEVNHEYKTVYFGAHGYTDYTTTHNDEKKRLYLIRHAKNENWNDPMSPGALSRYLLWNKPTLRESINDFKRKFNL